MMHKFLIQVHNTLSFNFYCQKSHSFLLCCIEASKPEDWDENEPKRIVDPNATKPDSWLEDAPQTIPNPEIERPNDWDDEEVNIVCIVCCMI